MMYDTNAKDNFVDKRSKQFASRIIKLYKFLTTEKNEFILSKQILRSGTSIGANIAEAEYAQSKPDFYNKLGIAVKEGSETHYWLDLLSDNLYISESQYKSLISDLDIIMGMLVNTLKTNNSNR